MVRIVPDAPFPEIEATHHGAYVNIRPQCPNPYAVAGFTVEDQMVTCSLRGAVALYRAFGEALADPAVAATVAALLGETSEVRRDDADPIGRAA